MFQGGQQWPPFLYIEPLKKNCGHRKLQTPESGVYAAYELFWNAAWW
jgi:hypothetical protein